MDNIKVALSIELPGGTLLAKEVCESDPKNYDLEKVTFSHTTKDGKFKKESATIRVRGSIPARQSIKLTQEAYAYMTTGECPGFAQMSTWKRMNKKQRLEEHLKQIMLAMGGTDFSYEVFPD